MSQVGRALGAHAAAVYFLLYFPIVVLIVFSFNAGRSSLVFEGLTLSWYARALSNRALLEALGNSLVVGLLTSTTASVLGLLFVLATQRSRRRGTADFLALMPLVVPEIVLATALLLFVVGFVRPSLGALGIVFGSVPAIVFGHFTFASAYVIVLCRARLAGFDGAQVDAARSLGATPAQVLRRVILPFLAPTLLSGWLLALTVSLDDFYVSYFLTLGGSGFATLPTYLFGLQARSALTPEMNAVASLMILVSFLLLSLVGALHLRTLRPSRPPVKGNNP